MKIKGKYKKTIKIINWGLIIFGMLSSFITLPPVIAFILSVALFIIGILIDKLIYTYSTFHVMPLPNDNIIFNRIGSVWSMENYQNKEYIVFGQAYKTKTAASEAFNLMRQWNYMDYIDRNQNIVLSIIDEGENRYTILLYPGKRGIEEFHDDLGKKTYGDNSETKVIVFKTFYPTFVDYSNCPEKIELMNRLKNEEEILLNTFYVKDNEPSKYSNRPIRLRKINIIKRNEILNGLENGIKWDENDIPK
jgi:uncharacterized protein YdhG (YjbR/CyaY superfamily)